MKENSQAVAKFQSVFRQNALRMVFLDETIQMTFTFTGNAKFEVNGQSFKKIKEDCKTVQPEDHEENTIVNLNCTLTFF